MQRHASALCLLSAEHVQCWLVRDRKQFFFVIADQRSKKPSCNFIKMSIKPSRVEKLRWKMLRAIRKQKMRVIQPCEDKAVSIGPASHIDEKTHNLISLTVLQAFVGGRCHDVQHAITKHIKEYCFVSDLLKHSEQEALSYCKAHDIALLHAKLHASDDELRKKEEWEEVIHARGGLQTGKAWIDLNLNV